MNIVRFCLNIAFNILEEKVMFHLEGGELDTNLHYDKPCILNHKLYN